MSRIYDISVPVKTGGLVYPGNPEIAIELQQAVARGAGANVSSIHFGSHTGTHVDAARHFFDEGEPVDQIALDLLIGPAIVISFDDNISALTASHLEKHDIRGHSRVLLKTRNSSFISADDFHRDYTYLAPDGAEFLVSKGVKLVGID